MEKSILECIDLTLKEEQKNYAEKIGFLVKKMLCKVLENNQKYIENNDEEYVFIILKRQVIMNLSFLFPGGFLEMFYTLAERDMKKIYSEYKE